MKKKISISGLAMPTAIILALLVHIYLPSAGYAWTIQGIDTPKKSFMPSSNYSSAVQKAIAIDRTTGGPHIVYGNDHLYHAYIVGNQWVTEIVDDSPNAGADGSIAVDSLGKIHIAYFDQKNQTLKYATNVLGSWEKITIDTNGGSNCCIALDSNNKVHISYIANNDGGGVRYITNASGSWVTTIIRWTAGEGSWAQYTSIAVDSANHIHISYWVRNWGMYHASNATGSWVQENIEYYYPCSIAVDSNNKVYVSYNRDGGISYITNVTGSWVTTTIDPAVYTSTLSPSIAIDSTNHLHMSYYDSTNKFLKYATNASGSWVITDVDIDGDVGMYSSIVLDSVNKVHIRYYDTTNGALKYATNASGSWVKTAVDRIGDVGFQSSIAVDPANNAHVAYYDTRNKDLKYATNTSGRWMLTTVDSTGDVGQYPSIKVDANAKAHISYYDATNANLKYATNATGAWVATTVDGYSWDTAGPTAIALDSNGKAHISYYDSTNHDLGYATNASGSWVISWPDLGGDVGLYNSIAVDSANHVHISYYDATNGGLKYATNTSGTWVAMTVTSSGTVDFGTYSSIAVDFNNIAYISFKVPAGSPPTSKRLATCNSGVCSTRGIYNGSGFPNEIGGNTSIALSPRGEIHVSFYNSLSKGLAFCKNPTEVTGLLEPVPNTGEIGSYTSMTVDSEYKVHISYYDVAESALKYLTTSVIDVTPPTGTVKINDGAALANSTNISLQLSCGDLQNVCSQMKFSNDGVTFATPLDYNSGAPWSLADGDGDGLKTVYAMFMDAAGNWSDPVSATIKLDTSPPETKTLPEGATFSTPQHITLTCQDTGGAVCADTWYSLDGNYPYSPYSGPITINKNLTLKYFSKDSLGNTETVKSTDYSFTPGYTKLSLELSSPTIEFNGSVTIFGRLQNMSNPSNNADPTGEKITIKIIDPDGIQTTLDSPIVNNAGQYIQQLDKKADDSQIFSKKGAYIISVHFGGASLLSPSDSAALPLLVGASAGYAILVEGKLSGQSSEGLDSHNKTANRIYQKLKSRGFVDDNIYYFNYDTTQPGVDAVPSRAEIQFAIQFWAKSRMNGQPAPLSIIMVDHGSINEFHIDDEIIAPADLAGWLTTLEAGLNHQALLEKRVVIIGSCFSGSFIGPLSKSGAQVSIDTQKPDAAGRVIITSAAPDEVSYKGPLEEGGIRSGEYFLEELFTQLERGQTIRQSFIEATSLTRAYTQKGGDSTNSNVPYFDGAVQHPMLDDNGDHTGSNNLSNDPTQDGATVASLVLGAGVGLSTNSALNPAEIDQVTPSRHLSSGQSTAQLWATVKDIDQVDSAVWVEIRNMSQALTTTTGTEQVALDTTKIPMVLNGTLARYEVTVTNLTENGRYDVFYFVRDKDTLKLAPMKRSVVYHNIDSSNPLPPAPDMTDAEPVNASHQSTSLYFGWGAVSDSAPPHPPISYSLFISKTPNFNPDSDPLVYRLENLAVNHAVVGPEANLQYKDENGNYNTYYWQVRAIDRYGAFSSNSTVMMFDTATPDNADVVVLMGSVLAAGTSLPIRASVVVSGNMGYSRQAVADVDGSYHFSNLGTTGPFTVTTTADGYADNIKPITIVSQGRLTTFTQNVVMASALVNDTTAPTVSLTSPTNGSMVSGTVAVTASASDNVGVTKVEFYVNSVLQAIDTASPYSFNWDTAFVATGSYLLRAKAYDAAGNIEQSPYILVYVIKDSAPVVVLMGNVLAAGTSLPIRASVVVSGNMGYSRQAVADVDGLYHFSNLGTTGAFTVTTTAAGYADNIKPITIVSQGAITTFIQNVQMAPASATHSITVTVTGSGSGSITSAPQDAQGGISCMKGPSGRCSASFPASQHVDLAYTRSSGSIFGGWTEDCIDVDPCSFATMNTDRNVTATFIAIPPFFLYSASPTPGNYKSTLQEAYDAAVDVILMQTTIPAGGLTVPPAPAKTVTIKGGYDADFTPNPGATSFTAIQGQLLIRSGTLRVERVRIR